MGILPHRSEEQSSRGFRMPDITILGMDSAPLHVCKMYDSKLLVQFPKIAGKNIEFLGFRGSNTLK